MLLFVPAFSGCISDEPKGIALGPGDKLPEFSVEMNNGQVFSTETLRGKVPVIVFFNTSCGDCRKELPVIQQLWEVYKEDDTVKVIPVAREQSLESIEEYWVDNGLTMPFSPQDNRDVYELFAPSIIPRIYIANQEGEILYAYGDTHMASLEDLLQDIQNIMDKK